MFNTPFWIRTVESGGESGGSAGSSAGESAGGSAGESAGAPGSDGSGDGDGGSGEAKTFSQEDVDKLMSKVRSEERRKASEKFGDYDDLKEKAGKSRSLEERIAAMEKASADAELKALRAEIAAENGLSTEDRDLLLTGGDEDTIRQQAKHIAEKSANARKRGPSAPREGNKTTPNASEEREAARQLFGT